MNYAYMETCMVCVILVWICNVSWKKKISSLLEFASGFVWVVTEVLPLVTAHFIHVFLKMVWAVVVLVLTSAVNYLQRINVPTVEDRHLH